LALGKEEVCVTQGLPRSPSKMISDHDVVTVITISCYDVISAAGAY